jgi:nucleoside-diphosphate-sugar epimerase
MRVLLTGATGFTGGHVLDLLLAGGHDVMCFARPTSDTARLERRGVAWMVGDLADASSVVPALEGVDAVINVASFTYGRGAGLASACQEAGVERAIIFSSTSIFTGVKPRTENPKVQAEQLIKASGLRCTILRPTMIYGTHEDRNMCRLVSYLDRHVVIPILGSGEHLLQPVHVDDLARAVLLALENPASAGREYNVPGADALTYNQVVDTTARLLGRKVAKLHVPLRLAVAALKVYGRLVDKPALHAEQARRLNEDKDFSYGEIRENLGYAPRTFEEGMASEIEEIRAWRESSEASG